MNIFETFESKSRRYCRSFPTIFSTAKNAIMSDENGKEYIDFFAGAGALNYGHNNDLIKKEVIQYLREDGIIQGLDMSTVAKKKFLEEFHLLLKNRKMEKYKVHFSGPSGTDAVESALKIARRYNKRKNILYFSKSFHGITLGSLSVTDSLDKQKSAGVPITDTLCIPYNDCKSFASFQKKIEVGKIELPAAIIVEIIQGEGGINVATKKWIQMLEIFCKKNDTLLIVDDIQMGCGRTGKFFSFEKLEIQPDIICLSKSIGGYGLPMSIVLINPKFDQWKGGENSGTFRGNNLAFVAAKSALSYWKKGNFEKSLLKKERIIQDFLSNILNEFSDVFLEIRGCGLVYGIEAREEKIAKTISEEAFKKGLVFECCGKNSEVIKIMPPLTIEEEVLKKGCSILRDAITSSYKKDPKTLP